VERGSDRLAPVVVVVVVVVVAVRIFGHYKTASIKQTFVNREAPSLREARRTFGHLPALALYGLEPMRDISVAIPAGLRPGVAHPTS
jgi:hypothetical protein